jgi:hypothetical protein
VNDDWRLQVELHDESLIDPVVERLGARELADDLSEAFHDRVIVSRNGAELFLYAGTRDQAERARDLLEALDEKHDWSLDIDFKRWHPEAEAWRDPDEELPTTVQARQAEHKARIEAERKQVEEQGYPEFEVRIDLPSRDEAERFAEQLREEGLPTVHRWKYLLIGATDEDHAKTLADRIRSEAPTGSRVAVEGTWQAALAERPRNPFAIFGGLGG